MNINLNKNNIVKIGKNNEYIILNKCKCQNIKTNKIQDISFLNNKKNINLIAIQEEFNITF